MFKEFFQKKKSPIKANKSTPGLMKGKASTGKIVESNSTVSGQDIKEPTYGPDYMI